MKNIQICLFVLIAACAPKPAPVATTPEHDAGTAATASCKSVCARLDTKLHCSEMWPSTTCLAGCAAQGKSGLPYARTRACWLTATTCGTAETCSEAN